MEFHKIEIFSQYYVAKVTLLENILLYGSFNVNCRHADNLLAYVFAPYCTIIQIP